jgi:hypothetical protein
VRIVPLGLFFKKFPAKFPASREIAHWASSLPSTSVAHALRQWSAE